MAAEIAEVRRLSRIVIAINNTCVKTVVTVMSYNPKKMVAKEEHFKGTRERISLRGLARVFGVSLKTSRNGSKKLCNP